MIDNLYTIEALDEGYLVTICGRRIALSADHDVLAWVHDWTEEHLAELRGPRFEGNIARDSGEGIVIGNDPNGRIKWPPSGSPVVDPALEVESLAQLLYNMGQVTLFHHADDLANEPEHNQARYRAQAQRILEHLGRS